MPLSGARSRLVNRLCRTALGVGALLVGFMGAADSSHAQVSATPTPPTARSAAERVVDELDALDAWLGSGANAQRWRDYLGAQEIRGAAQLGIDADAAAVTAALQRFSSGANGLELPRFAAVRDALRAWQAALAQRGSVDLSQRALAEASQ